jgi:enoyl-[acyl-carrier protein] reductase III
VAIVHLQNEAAAAETAREACARGARVLVHRANVASGDEVEELVARLSREAGRLDGLVHCAALGAPADTLDRRPNRWRLAWDTHVGALIDLLARTRPLLCEGAAVVALSSLGARRVMAGYGPIAAAKGALESLVAYLAAELAGSGVNVNAVCGGPVDTDSLRRFPAFADLERQSRQRPSGRMGRPEDIAPIVAFLLGPGARWIRGQVVVADGGFGLY